METTNLHLELPKNSTVVKSIYLVLRKDETTTAPSVRIGGRKGKIKSINREV